MEFDVKELVRTLKMVMPGLGGKSVIEQANHFVFTPKRIVTFNDQICVSHPFPCGDITPFSAPSDELFSILSGIKEEEIEVTISEGKMKIETESTTAEISIKEEGHIFSNIKFLDDIEITVREEIPEGFIEGVKLCLFSVSRDITRGFLSCVSINEDSVLSSDDCRISWYKMKGKMRSVLIPLVSASKLIQYEVKQFIIDSSWIHFFTEDNVVFSSRILSDEFPECAEAFEVEGVNLSLPKEMKDAITSTSIFSEGMTELDRVISIDVKKGKISCKSENQTGKLIKKMKIDYDGPEFSFYANPFFMSQVLEHLTKITVGKSKALFSSGSFLHVMALPVE